MSRVGDVVSVELDRMATGGESVGRLEDGRVVFVAGAVAEERALVELTEMKKRFARAIAVQIERPSPARIVPGCQHAASGECGGCDWMHIDLDSQRDHKVALVAEQLTRLGGVSEPPVRSRPVPDALRTTVRCAITAGRAGYRPRRSRQSFAAQACPAAHPLVEELIVAGDFGDNSEATIRVSVATGERLVVVDRDLESVTMPADVTTVLGSEPGEAAVSERVAGRMWRVSARSFFQPSPGGAEALVDEVRSGLGGGTGPVADLYAGVGLLGAGAVAARAAVAVESNRFSAGDAAHNLGDSAKVIKTSVERWRPDQPYDAVVADPARAGLGADGVAAVDRSEATRAVLVSCDLGALGRDIGLLRADGWTLERSVLVDQFPETSRVEVVSTLTR